MFNLHIASLLSLWFKDNYLKINDDKSHLLVFGSIGNEVTVSISGSLMQEIDEEKLLSVILDKKLSFKNHVNILRTNASQKLDALARVSKYTEKSHRIDNDFFFTSHFNYCHLFRCFMIGNLITR